MGVYVDEIREYPPESINPKARRWGNLWCHMAADSIQELMAMARTIGLKGGDVQRGGSGRWYHFDLTPNKRKQAIAAGAKEITACEMIEKMKGAANDLQRSADE